MEGPIIHLQRENSHSGSHKPGAASSNIKYDKCIKKQMIKLRTVLELTKGEISMTSNTFKNINLADKENK